MKEEKQMNAIAVVDKNWGLGKDGKLLAHLSGDLRYFKEKTLGKTIIIGRATFDSMGGRLLPNRETAILSKKTGFAPGCTVLKSLDEALCYVSGKPEQDVFVAGGEAVYKLLLPYCGALYITKIQAAFEADRFFPNLDEQPRGFKVRRSSGLMEENGVSYQFFEYIKE